MSYGVSDFGTMVDDAVRRNAYLEAMRRHITPESRVLDLGCGFGFFTLAALSMGAREVVAVEPLDSVRLLPDVIHANGYAERAAVYQGDVRELEMGRFDLVVSDLRGSTPLYGDHLDVLAYVNEHLLAPAGILIPSRDRLCLALVHAPEWFERRRRPMHLDEHDWSVVEHVVLGEPSRVTELGEGAIASTPLVWAQIDYRSLLAPVDRHWSGSGSVVAAHDTVHGLVAWFEAEIDRDLEFSTAPSDYRPTYGRMVYPFVQPLEVDVGAEAGVALAAHKVGSRWVWEWSVAIDGVIKKGSTLDGLQLGQTTLRALRGDAEATRLL